MPHFSFSPVVLDSRRFQLGFDRFDLHCPTQRCENLANSATKAREAGSTAYQGLTLVHFSAQPEPFLWNMGCIQGLFRERLGGVKGY